jgi:transcriptional regulator with XRE-family HTH domain
MTPGAPRRRDRSGRLRGGFHIEIPGVIGGAMISAARRSADLTREALAERLGTPPRIMAAWETGVVPLYCVTYNQLRDLARVFAEEYAMVPASLDDLLLASQCDLLLAGMLDGSEDYAEVPPIDQGRADGAARALVRWALEGTVPAEYAGYARPGPLLPAACVSRVAAIATRLADGSQGDDLAGFGAVLLELAVLPADRPAGQEEK